MPERFTVSNLGEKSAEVLLAAVRAPQDLQGRIETVKDRTRV